MAGLVIQALQRHGTRTRLVLRWGGPLEEELRSAAGEGSFEPFRRVRAEARRRHAARLARTVEELAAVLVLLRRRPDAVWANTAKSASWLRPCLRLRIPVVLHAHETGTLLRTTLDRYPLGRRWAQVRLVACSIAAADDLAAATGVSRAGITVVPSLIDQAETRARARSDPSAETPTGSAHLVVGACGLANRGKGFDLFLSVTRDLASRPDMERVAFRWIGKVDAEASQLAAAQPADARVQLVGEVTNAPAELSRLDIVTVPSREDAFPLVVLEAMTLGRPVAAFAVGGIPELLGDAGVLVEPEDVSGLAAAIAGLVSDPAARQSLGNRAATRAAEVFGFEQFEDAIADVLGQLGLDQPNARLTAD